VSGKMVCGGWGTCIRDLFGEVTRGGRGRKHSEGYWYHTRVLVLVLVLEYGTGGEYRYDIILPRL